MPNTLSSEQLAADNHDLRTRLEHAEATLSELLSGEADALFVTGAGGAQLFSLKGADQTYRLLIENMSEGALTLTSEGLVLYANRRVAEMLRTPLERMIGSQINDWIAPENRQVLQALLQKDEFDNHRVELVLTAADGAQVPVYLSVSRLVLDEIDSVCMVVTDLTEQKRNEAILAAEKLSNAILEQAADAIVICDKAGRIMRASKQAQELYGKSLLGQLFEQAIPLRRPDGTAFFPLGIIDTNRQSSSEARLEHDGQSFDLLVRVGHLKGARDELLGSVVTLTDVTERKQTEMLVHRKQAELRVLIDLLPAMIWFKDTENRILRVNKHVAQAAGMSVEEIEGKPSAEIYPEDAAKYFADDLEVIRSGKPKLAIAETVRGPDNKILWVQTDKVPFCDKDGKVLGICVMAQDITERKQAETLLIENRERLRLATQSARIGIWDYDVTANKLVWDAQMYALYGIREQDFSGAYDAWQKGLHPDDLKKSDAAISAAIAGTRDFNIEFRVVWPNGEVHDIEAYALVQRKADGSGTRMIGVNRDITERKMAEDVLKKHTVELERFHRLSVGRELQMIELKKRINELAKQAGQKPPYELAFLAAESVMTNPDHEKNA